MSELSDKNFYIALDFLKTAEGGYSNHPNDSGGATKYGITHLVYDDWNKRHNLPVKNIKNITWNEAKNIYYNDYWKASGADKISDPKIAIALFDASVNHGVEGAKKIYRKSDKTLKGFLRTRNIEYKTYSNAADFGEGWSNRINDLNKYFNNLNTNPIYASNRHLYDVNTNNPFAITNSIGIQQNNYPDNFKNYANPSLTKGGNVRNYTRSDIANMNPQEYQVNRDAIFNQLQRTGTIPQ